MQENDGIVERWDDQKGFGFITTAPGKKIFFHISVVRGGNRPQKGDKVFYHPGKDEQGRPIAIHVRSASLALDDPAIRKKPVNKAEKMVSARIKKSPQKNHLRVHNISWGYLLLLLLLPSAGVLDLAISHQVPWGILVYALVSLLTYFFYWDDKRRAQKNEWRIPEANLHLWALAGGWPGAFIAQRQFRHKTKKVSFQAVFWLVVAVHQLLWADWLFMDGKGLVSLYGHS